MRSHPQLVEDMADERCFFEDIPCGLLRYRLIMNEQPPSERIQAYGEYLIERARREPKISERKRSAEHEPSFRSPPIGSWDG